MNKQQELEAKIRSLLPELQGLSFGCRGRTEKGEFAIYVSEVRDVEGWWVWHNKTDALSLYGKRRFNSPEIIGHDITLEHVLKVLGVITGEYTAGNQSLSFMWAGEPYGSCIEFDYWDRENGEVLAYWQLGKTLSDQSQEVIEFLHPIICTK